MGRGNFVVHLLSSNFFLVHCACDTKSYYTKSLSFQGFEQFSEYANYGNRLEFAHDLIDPSSRDQHGDLLNTLSAIDAVPYAWGSHTQYARNNTLRDINKAYVGFLQPYLDPEYKEIQYVSQRKATGGSASDKQKIQTRSAVNKARGEETKSSGTGDVSETGHKNDKHSDTKDMKMDKEGKGTSAESIEVEEPFDPNAKRVVATGNWGCGAFGGNPQLKCLLQWISASEAGCPRMVYYTFHEASMGDLHSVVNRIQELGWTVGELYTHVEQMCDMIRQENMDKSIFDYILGIDRNETVCQV